MDVRVFDDPAALGRFAAEQVLDAIAAQPDAVIGLATGSSPLALYSSWAELARERALDMSRVRGFALDEYAGIDADHPESYHSVITGTVVEPIGLTPELVDVPSAEASAEAAAAYEADISAAGGVDVQILGIGRNGHLGFNEPGSASDSRTRRVQLSAETIADNARFFDSEADVPTEAITQGLGTIMEARKLVILAIGETKAAAVAAAIQGPVTENVPASFAQLHDNVVYILDTAAASKLR
ncbi:glucosamine-6-phosphate deaminase [Leucobacter sp. BZR 635]